MRYIYTLVFRIFKESYDINIKWNYLYREGLISVLLD